MVESLFTLGLESLATLAKADDTEADDLSSNWYYVIGNYTDFIM